MAACGRSSHGEVPVVRLSLVLLLAGAAAAPAVALRPKTSKRKGHTLDDLLVQNVTAADVEHSDAMRFVREGIAYMEQLGIKLSEQCERRYGYTFITDQKFHHFRLCKSEARLDSDGKLVGVQRGASALAKYRVRYAKKLGVRSQRLKAAAASGGATGGQGGAKPADKPADTAVQPGGGSNGGAAEATAKRRRSVLQDDGVVPDSLTIDRAGDRRQQSERVHARRRQDGEQQQQQPQEVTARGELLGQSDLGEATRPTLSSVERRRLQAAGNGSALLYKILNYVNTKKDDDDGGSSDVYNDDDDEEDDAANAAFDDDNGDDAAGAGTAAAGPAPTVNPKRNDNDPSYGSLTGGKRKAEVLSNAFEPDVEVPELSAVGTTYKSSVGCYLQPSMPRNVGYKDAQLLCVGRNVVLDTCAHYDGQNAGFDVRFPKPKVGSLKLGCSVKIHLLGERNLTKGYKNRLWWINAQDNAYDTVRQSCDPASGRVVEHPVAFVMRDRYTHTLHELEVLSTIFTSLAVADLPEVRERGVQIVIADQMPHASYRPTYAAISYPYRLRHLADAPYPPNTCFRTALFINAFTNSIAFNPNPNTSTCFSPVMIGVHRWLRTLHKELDPAYLARVHHHASETGGIVRRSVVWTSRRNLEALRLTSGVGMTEWQSARMVPNENEVVTALQSAILRWNSRSCLLARYYEGDEGLAGCRDSNVQFDLVFGEFSDWPYYPDQLMTIYRTGVLIGVHGAALTFVASTAAGESALLELAGLGWEDTQTGNMLNLFPSLARNMGAYYEQVRYQGPDIDTKIATDALVRAMDEVSTRIMANQRSKKLAEEPRFNDQYNFDVMFPHACPTSVKGKLRRYVTNHPVQMALNASSGNASSSGAISGGGGGGGSSKGRR